MNIHHLELFYYVAKHGGISEAVRNIPYGIQQPAVSSQVLQLEECLDVTLFHRRPFALTPPGEKLYRFIEPFFSQVDVLADELRGGTAHQIRLGASEVVLRDHVPELVQNVRKKFPKLKLILREGYQPQLLEWLEKQELDLVVTLLDHKPPSGTHSLPLLKLPLTLLVTKNSKITSAEELWKRDRIEEPLICLPANQIICKNFQAGLNRLGIDWFPSIEVSSVALIQTYVANGYGIGLGVGLPKNKNSNQVRELPLENFDPVVLGALWQGKVTPLIQAFLDEMQRRVQLVTN